MKPVPRISEAEWEIMKVLWAEGGAPASTIIEKLRVKDRSWHPKTVKTYLTRLVKKEALEYRREGRAYVYSALITENMCVAAASQSFLERVFGGALKPMLAHFVQSRRLPPEEIRELKNLLESEKED